MVHGASVYWYLGTVLLQICCGLFEHLAGAFNLAQGDEVLFLLDILTKHSTKRLLLCLASNLGGS